MVALIKTPCGNYINAETIRSISIVQDKDIFCVRVDTHDDSFSFGHSQFRQDAQDTADRLAYEATFGLPIDIAIL